MSDQLQMRKLAIHGGEPVRRQLLSPAYPGATWMDAEELALLRRVIESRSPFRFAGPDVQGMVDTFEQEASRFLGVRHALALSSGTAALKAALAALRIGPGDEVIVPAAAFDACPNAVTLMGARPVFAEVDESLGLDPHRLASALTPRTRAIMVVHLYGGAADLAGISEVAQRKGLPIIEDCAQAWGATFNHQPVGSIGTIGAFSLQMNKHITAGEGGCVCTNDAELFERAWRYHDHGNVREVACRRLHPALPPFIGENLRMSELAGAVALAQLRKLPAMLRVTRRHHRAIVKQLEEVDFWPMRRLPDPQGDAGMSIGFFAGSPQEAQAVADAVSAEGISCKTRPYGGAIYLRDQIAAQRLYHHAAGGRPVYPPGTCPLSESLLARYAYVSLGPDMSDEDARDVAEALVKVAANLR